MEGSKTFSKDFMARHDIPTASYRNFRDHAAALAYVSSINHPIVIKASGLAAGKGVLIPTTKEEAVEGLKQCMLDKNFGPAGDEIVVEEFLTGQELSILAFSDGYTALALPGAQDHKRIGDGDTGPNTGGMGVYAPTPCATKDVEEEIMRTIVQPTIDGMRRDGTLSASISCAMRTNITFYYRHAVRRDALHGRHAHTDRAQGPRIQRSLRRPRNRDSHGPPLPLHRSRRGPPGAPLPCSHASRLELTPSPFKACVERRLDCIKLEMKKAFAVTVILASKGYPGPYTKGVEIQIGELPESEPGNPSLTTLRRWN